MTNGERVVAVASKYLGVAESSPNRGSLIDQWEADWGLRGLPWCGMFVAAMYKEAGVDDAGLAHPSTAEMCRRAHALGAVWDGHGHIPVGAIWVACSVHTCLIADGGEVDALTTIEGNHHNAVGMGIRSAAEGLVIIPPALRQDAPPPPSRTRYFIEDTAVQPRLYGPWETKQARERMLQSISPARRQHARLVRGKAGGYAWVEGPRRLYGPWASKEARDHALNALKPRLGKGLRAYSKQIGAPRG